MGGHVMTSQEPLRAAQTIEDFWKALYTATPDTLAPFVQWLVDLGDERTELDSAKLEAIEAWHHATTLDDPDEPTVDLPPYHPLERWQIHWDEFWQQDHTTADWLLEPVLARGRAHALYASAKTGKSLLVLEACAALATGGKFLGKKVERATVLYLDYEMTPADLFDRLTDMGYGPGTDLSRLHYISLPQLDPVNTPAGGAAIVQAAIELGADLVVIDTVTRAIGGDENTVEPIREMYRHCLMPIKAAGIATVRIDHAGKDIDKGQRGSSAKNDDVDVVWRLKRLEGEQLELAATHKRMGWVPDSIVIERTEDTPMHRRVDVDETATWPAGTKGCADDLDRLKVPLDATYLQAKAMGATGRKKVVLAALKWRRESIDDSVKPVDKPVDAWFPMSGNQSDSVSDSVIGNQTGTVIVSERISAGQSPDLGSRNQREPWEPSGSAPWFPVPPPIGGTRDQADPGTDDFDPPTDDWDLF